MEALTHIGGSVRCSSSPKDIQEADKVILPGVGAFADGIAGIRSSGLEDPLKDFAASGRPLLGICLGMQMLFRASYEFGTHSGLSLFDAEIKAIPKTDVKGETLRVPHMGWNSVYPDKDNWEGTILGSITPGTCFYFAHSFAYMDTDNNNVSKLGVSFHGGLSITAVARTRNITGVQFHPERSGKAGLTLLESFLSLS
jgi:glutamine amidotransferase